MARIGWVCILMAGGLTALIASALIATGLATLPAGLVAVNIATALGYGYDKHQARSGGRRVPETALHLLAAVGGTPGAFVGQRLFHHKTRDRRFQVIFWLILVSQIVTVVAIVYLRSR